MEKLQKKKIISVIEYVIIALVLIFNIYIIVKVVIVPAKTPDLFGYKAFTILSKGMENNINVGDIAIVKDAVEPQVNDIIAFKNGDEVILHRIVEKSESEGNVKYKTKGDANENADIRTVDKADIEGVYCSKVPYVGFILIFLYKYYMYIIVAILIYLLFKVVK